MTANEPESLQSRRAAVVALIVIAAIVLAVLFVMNRLNQSAALQDCLASGRTNCEAIETPPR